MRLRLVPEGSRRKIIIQRLVLAIWPPTQILDRNPQVGMEIDGIGHMPPVQAPLHTRHVILVFVIQNVSDVRSRVGRGKAIIRAEVILGACSRDGRILTVAVDVELYFTFAGPSACQLRPREEGADIPAFAADSIKNGVGGMAALHAGSPPLRVEVTGLLRKLSRFIIDLKR